MTTTASRPGWVEHLLAGGTTPWVSYDGPAGHDGRFLPGAQQLELLRRLNLAGRPSAALAERVARASAPGRGRPDLELLGATTPRRFGPPPVDPAALPDAELLRVATGLLAQDVAAAPLPAPPRPPRRWRIRYELAGDPFRALPLTEALTADGRPPGGAGRAVLVLGADVPTMLAHAWAARCLALGAPAWPDFVHRTVARDRLPRRVALAAVAERAVARPHTGRVSVVLDPAALPGLLGVRSLPPVPEVSWAGAELARQVGTALSLLVTPPEQAARLEEVLRPRLVRLPGLVGPPPAVPPEHEEWTEEAGARLHRRLTRAGYPVVGDPGAVMPGPHPPAATRSAGPSVLDLAIRLLLEGDR